jgi:hypothetical protein
MIYLILSIDIVTYVLMNKVKILINRNPKSKILLFCTSNIKEFCHLKGHYTSSFCPLTNHMCLGHMVYMLRMFKT